MEKNKNSSQGNERKSDWMIFPLHTTIEYQEAKVEKLDLSRLNEMKLKDMNGLYESYVALGGTNAVMQESTLLFAQLAASWATGHPMELLDQMGARDVIKLKNRIYRFFYL